MKPLHIYVEKYYEGFGWTYMAMFKGDVPKGMPTNGVLQGSVVKALVTLLVESGMPVEQFNSLPVRLFDSE